MESVKDNLRGDILIDMERIKKLNKSNSEEVLKISKKLIYRFLSLDKSDFNSDYDIYSKMSAYSANFINKELAKLELDPSGPIFTSNSFFQIRASLLMLKLILDADSDPIN